MDPDEALRILRKAIADASEQMEAGADPSDLFLEIVGEFSALDSWLCLGGFLPKDWERKRGQNGASG